MTVSRAGRSREPCKPTGRKACSIRSIWRTREILGFGHYAIRGPLVRLAISFEVNGRAFAIRER